MSRSVFLTLIPSRCGCVVIVVARILFSGHTTLNVDSWKGGIQEVLHQLLGEVDLISLMDSPRNPYPDVSLEEEGLSW